MLSVIRHPRQTPPRRSHSSASRHALSGQAGLTPVETNERELALLSSRGLITAAVHVKPIWLSMHQPHRGPVADVTVTRREHEVIHLIAAGLSNREIGRRLRIAVRHVLSSVRRISEKLGIHTRLEIGAYARRNGKHE